MLHHTGNPDTCECEQVKSSRVDLSIGTLVHCEEGLI